MLASFADVIDHLTTRYTLSGGGPNWVELWWRLVVDGEHVPARPLERGDAQDRTTAVHYLKFPLPPSVVASLRSAVPPEFVVEVDHPVYPARAILTRETIASLAEDLQD